MDFHFKQGSMPLLVSMPHVGTDIPDQIAGRLSATGLEKPDTDWHLRQLYGFAEELGASTLAARWSRYVVDLNRPPENANLYPGQDTTGLCPVDTFQKAPLYLPGQEPDEAEIRQRLAAYWQPYHDQLRREVTRLLETHGVAVVWDAHSIASVLPRFFEGKLPDLNFGTADGKSCDPALAEVLRDLAAAQPTQPAYSHVFNGRFKGGYITRHYGQPQQRVHAIQLEMAQCIYMDEHLPFAYRPDLAQRLQPLLHGMLEAVIGWARNQAR